MAKGISLDAKYRAESDAHTLAQAKEIMMDPGRHKAAVKQAGMMATEQMNRAKAMKQIANKKVK